MTVPHQGEIGPFRTRAGHIRWQVVAQSALMGVGLALVLSLILVVQFLPSRVRLKEGEVAPQDVLAPRDQRFESSILTAQAQALAASRVAGIRTAPDANIGRQQVGRAQQTLAYMDAVRHDDYSSLQERAAELAAIPGLELPSSVVVEVLSLDGAAWQEVVTETTYVISQVMRESIQEEELVDARRRASSFISRHLSPSQAEIVAELARNLIVPNSTYDARATEAEREKARSQVEPIARIAKKGEVIIQKGHVVDALDLEALAALGLQKTEISWPEVAGNVIFATLIVSLLGIYLWRVRPQIWSRTRELLLLALLVVVAILAAKFMVPGHAVLPYLLPVATVPMVLVVLLGPNLAILTAMLISLVVGFLGGGSLELAVYAFAGGTIAALALWRIERFNGFLWAAVYLALTNIGVAVAFRLAGHEYDLRALVELLTAAAINSGLSTSLTLGSFFMLGNIFGITTTFQLLDLAQPTQPLLRQLLLRAPGTYHHSIIVGNLAESAAQSIGANPLLARVGAYYHDIGKLRRPWFFGENQLDGVNVHDNMDPQTSADIVISHVRDGLALARQHKLPAIIQDFITQHHGTFLVIPFYHQALKDSNGQEVDVQDFRYPGPKPQTREAAILMLADICEAAIRSARTSSPEEIEELIGKVIQDRLVDGQLNECDLRLRDLERIRGAFGNILQGMYHSRVPYPEEERESAPLSQPESTSQFPGDVQART